MSGSPLVADLKGSVRSLREDVYVLVLFLVGIVGSIAVLIFGAIAFWILRLAYGVPVWLFGLVGVGLPSASSLEDPAAAVLGVICLLTPAILLGHRVAVTDTRRVARPGTGLATGGVILAAAAVYFVVTGGSATAVVAVMAAEVVLAFHVFGPYARDVRGLSPSGRVRGILGGLALAPASVATTGGLLFLLVTQADDSSQTPTQAGRELGRSLVEAGIPGGIGVGPATLSATEFLLLVPPLAVVGLYLLVQVAASYPARQSGIPPGRPAAVDDAVAAAEESLSAAREHRADGEWETAVERYARAVEDFEAAGGAAADAGYGRERYDRRVAEVEEEVGGTVRDAAGEYADRADEALAGSSAEGEAGGPTPGEDPAVGDASEDPAGSSAKGDAGVPTQAEDPAGSGDAGGTGAAQSGDAGGTRAVAGSGDGGDDPAGTLPAHERALEAAEAGLEVVESLRDHPVVPGEAAEDAAADLRERRERAAGGAAELLADRARATAEAAGALEADGEYDDAIERYREARETLAAAREWAGVPGADRPEGAAATGERIDDGIDRAETERARRRVESAVGTAEDRLAAAESAREAGEFEDALAACEDAREAAERAVATAREADLPELDRAEGTLSTVAETTAATERARARHRVESLRRAAAEVVETAKDHRAAGEYDDALAAYREGEDRVEEAVALSREADLDGLARLAERRDRVREAIADTERERALARAREAIAEGEAAAERGAEFEDEEAFADATEAYAGARDAYDRAVTALEGYDAGELDEAARGRDRAERDRQRARLSELAERINDARERMDGGDPAAAREDFESVVDAADELVGSAARSADAETLREQARAGAFRARIAAGRDRIEEAEDRFAGDEFREAEAAFEDARETFEAVVEGAEGEDLAGERREARRLAEVCADNAELARQAHYDVAEGTPELRSADEVEGVDTADPAAIDPEADDRVAAGAGANVDGGAGTGPGSDDGAAGGAEGPGTGEAGSRGGSPAGAGAASGSASGAGSGTAGGPGGDPEFDRSKLTNELPEIERLEPLGAGGSAEVTRVRLVDSGEIRALKEPKQSATMRTPAMEAFAAEAATWDQLAHRHVVELVDWGVTPTPWMLLEYMDGGDLAGRIGELSVAEGVDVVAGLAEAVDRAHRLTGMAHTDIKPENVLFTDEDGESVAKLADWGLARTMLGPDDRTGMTAEYAAPEQVDPDRFGGVGLHTDVYQLGTLAYEVFAGRHPYEGVATEDLTEAIADRDPDPPSTVNPQVPAGIDDAVATAMAKAPGDRFEAPLYLRDRLREAIGNDE